jgi:D-alanyl-D-alanine carboxypeptidase
MTTVLVVLGGIGSTADATTARPSPPAAADAALDRAIDQLVAAPSGPPGVAVVVQRASEIRLHGAGLAVVAPATRPGLDDHMRLASVSKAFNGAAALALVRDGALSLNDTIGARLPSLPSTWGRVTLAQLLNHTSGLPDFSQSKFFQHALAASLLSAPPPVQLLSFVATEPLAFRPGSRFAYSNSDNIVVGLMIEAVSGRSYGAVLQEQVYGPLGLTRTSLPSDATIPNPFIHGYALAPGQAPEDASEAFAAGWTWASGGIVSTPADADRFIRQYATGATTDRATLAKQFRFVAGNSEPPGPGVNAAGLGIFRYQTSCGTVYGHTGNTAGYTQFVAATRDGSRSATVSVNAQVNPSTGAKLFPTLRRVFSAAVCAALARA